MIDDVLQGMWATLNLPSSLNILDATEIEDSTGNHKLYAGTDDGQILELFADDTFSWTLTSGSSTPIVTKFRTPYMRLGDKEGGILKGRVLPRFIELKAKNNSSTETTWKVTIDMSEGPDSDVPKDTVTLNMKFGVNNSLIRQSTRDLHPHEYFRLQIENSDSDIDSSIESIKVYYKILEGQFEVITVDNST
jgi:hypothetical protein